MTGLTSKGLRALTALSIALSLLPSTALAAFERVGPTSTVNGYPVWFQDKTGITLEFCSPETQAELEGGYCLLLPAVPPETLPVAPEIFPTAFFDEHFYWSGGAIGTMAGGGRAVLVLALEGAFATGPVVPGEQIVFGRLRFDFRSLPLSGTYKIYTPFGIRTFPGQVAGNKSRLFYTEDIGLSCAPGDFSCALQATVGPFLLPSNEPGGAELDPWTDALIPGKLYIADPARTGPVTGSIQGTYQTAAGPLDPNRFRIEVDTGTAVVTILDVTDFSLQGRIHQQPIPSRVQIDRASYGRSANNDISVDVYATGEPTLEPRLPGPLSVPSAKVFPQLEFFNSPCGGTIDPANPDVILPPFTAPSGGSVPMPHYGTAYYGHSTPTTIPAGVCVANLNAKNAAGVVVPHYDPAPVGDQVFISEAFFDPTTSSLSVFASSSDLWSPPQLSVGAFGDLAGNQPLTNGVAVLSPIAAPPNKVRVLSQEGGAAEMQVTVGRRPATSVTLSANLLSPQVQGAPLVLTAAGQGSSGYLYRFVRSIDGGGTWQVVQDWSSTATYAVQANTPPVALQFYVEVKTTNLVARDAASSILNFTLLPAPATGVTVTPNQTSPQLTGVAVDFLAQGQGSTGYTYRFFRSSNNGATWTMIRDWSADPIYRLPATTASGTYLVYAEVRTTTLVLRDAVSPTVSFSLSAVPASGVTVSTSLLSPQLAGTSVDFTAAGVGSVGYSYRFFRSTDGGATWQMVRDWGTAATYTLPSYMAPGTYLVYAEVRTSPLVARDAVSPTVTFTITAVPASAVIVTPGITSPQPIGTAATFTAAGEGSSGYMYRFFRSADNGLTWTMVRDWSSVATYTLPNYVPPATYLIYAEVRTSALVARDAQSPTVAFTIFAVPASAVTVSTPTASPQFNGTAVTFTAAGEGSTAAYSYRFFRSADAGLTWTVVRDWSTVATYTLPNYMAPANYLIRAEVRTSPLVVRDAVSADYPFTILAVPATAVTVTPGVSSPQPLGTAVPFVAAGAGSTNAYSYRFFRSTDGGATWVMVRDWSTATTYVLPNYMAKGTYLIHAEVRTSTLVALDAVSPDVTFVIQ